MGQICNKGQKNFEAQISFDLQPHLPISIEKTPKNIQQSLKHNLQAKYIENECSLCEKPQSKEVAIQTSISFINMSSTGIQSPKKEKCNQKKSQKKQKQQQKNDRTQSVSLKKRIPLQKQFTSLNQSKERKLNQNPYIVLINSQKDNIWNSQDSVQNLNRRK